MDKLVKADAARIQAMIDANIEGLRGLLHDNLSWTHSSGRTDDKVALLAVIKSGETVYKSLAVSDRKITMHDSVYIYSGLVEGRAEVNGIEKQIRNKFLSVWVESTNGLQMLAWQSTGL